MLLFAAFDGLVSGRALPHKRARPRNAQDLHEGYERVLLYLQSRGNDLITPAPQFGFPGLIAGDKWCVCALSWLDAYEAGVAAPVVLEACDSSVLQHIPLSPLQEHVLKEDE